MSAGTVTWEGKQEGARDKGLTDSELRMQALESPPSLNS